MSERRLEFEDVVRCKNVAEFNEFAHQYLEQKGLKGEEKRRTYWALFYKWKGDRTE